MVYWGGLSGGFIFDDHATIVQNSRLHLVTLEPSSLWKAATSFEPGGTLGIRPLPMASFAINYLIGGADPWGYKFAGLLVHLINTLLVYRLVVVLLSLPSLAQQNWGRWAPFAIALLWAVHPLQVSSVLYVVQRMETLAYTFILLTLLSYLRGRRAQLEGRGAGVWLCLCLLLWSLGLACKESAVLLPAFTLALEFSVLGFAAADVRVARTWRWLYGLVCISIIIILIVWALPHYWHETYVGRDFGSYERVLSQLRILPMYLMQILLPIPGNMTFYYDDFIVSRGWLSPWTTLGGGGLLVFIVGFAWWWRKCEPIVWLGVLWFFASHTLTSNIVPLELVFEHRNYFSLFGVALAVAGLVRHFPTRDGSAIKYLAVIAVLTGVGGLGLVRSLTWGEPLLLATELAGANKSSGRASSNLATIYYEMADGNPGSPFNDFALTEFARGSQLPGASVVSDQGRILLASSLGRDVPDEWWLQLISKLERGPISPETTSSMFGLLSNRMNGVVLDDKYLVQAFVAMFDKVRMPAHSYAQFADYALNIAGEQLVAEVMFGRAILFSDAGSELPDSIFHNLRKQGDVEMADRLQENYRQQTYSLNVP